ncbi:hypothetical protein SCUCBS95973_004431 [Sporothrix curviconia]|uniref:CBM-cenC domain-containing protein n=1 Tax=Sporothrix curviconia TaxID=1260050 RepID=A0ABP0BQC5_9PEZI
MQVATLLAAISALAVGRVLANPCKPVQPTSSTASPSQLASSTSSSALTSSSLSSSSSSASPTISSSTSLSTTISSSSSTVNSASSSSSATASSSSVAASPTCGVNAVSNANFDGGDSTGASGASLVPWTATSTSGGAYSFVTGHDSPYAINLYTTGAGTVTISQTLETVPGETYTMSFLHYYDLGGTTTTSIECTFDNSYNTYKLLYGSVLAKGQWVTYSGEVPVTASTTTYTCKWTSAVSSAIYLEAFAFSYAC